MRPPKRALPSATGWTPLRGTRLVHARPLHRGMYRRTALPPEVRRARRRDIRFRRLTVRRNTNPEWHQLFARAKPVARKRHHVAVGLALWATVLAALLGFGIFWVQPGADLSSPSLAFIVLAAR